MEQATPDPVTTMDAQLGRARAAAVEALARFEEGRYCGERDCPASVRNLAQAALSGRQPLPECPGHESARPERT
jgi:hypothetical protein